MTIWVKVVPSLDGQFIFSLYCSDIDLRGAKEPRGLWRKQCSFEPKRSPWTFPQALRDSSVWVSLHETLPGPWYRFIWGASWSHRQGNSSFIPNGKHLRKVRSGALLSERLRRWSNKPDVVATIPVTTDFFLISCDSNQVPKWFGTHYNLEVPL